MKLLLIVVAVALGAYLVYAAYSFYIKVQASKVLVEAATSFQLVSSDYTKTILIIGDSTGVGVGAARSEDSVAALLARNVGATYVENRAVSGAVVADLPKQVREASLYSYDLVLVQIGGNDIVRFHNPDTTASRLGEVLASLKVRTDTTYVMSAGNVGAATLFPYAIRYFHTRETLKYHEAFARVAQTYGAHYVNLYTSPEDDPFTKEPAVYLAVDGFHPSSQGYALWFSELKKQVPTR